MVRKLLKIPEELELEHVHRHRYIAQNYVFAQNLHKQMEKRLGDCILARKFELLDCQFTEEQKNRNRNANFMELKANYKWVNEFYPIRFLISTSFVVAYPLIGQKHILQKNWLFFFLLG